MRSFLALLLGLGLVSAATAIDLPPGFQDDIIATGLEFPTVVRFSPDGRMFVAEKSGLIKVFDGPGDPTPDVFADLRMHVFNSWDRGLLGLALHPDFPDTPQVFVLYTYNAMPGGTAPFWPASDPEGANDFCPNPPGSMADGCVATGRLSRLEVEAGGQVSEHPLIENEWCQQFPSHTVGDLAFGADGALYVSGGDGASFGTVDWGQYGGTLPDPTAPLVPRNPCGDPPGGVGGAMTPPAAEGGALRSQDLRSPGDPLGYSGTVLRLDPASGQALPDNPMWGGATADDDRVVAFGLRNPFRIATRPGTSEVWVGDVGWSEAEEIDRIADPTAMRPANFGWPCYEGSARQPSYDSANLSLCESLYGAADDTKPYFHYRHDEPVGGPECDGPSSSIAGLAFYAAGDYPGDYAGALFFADYSRGCIWTMPTGGGGLPDPARVTTFASQVPGPVMLERGPNGDLVYVEIGGLGWRDGKVHRIRYTGENHPPVAVATADVTAGRSPLMVHFDGSASADADPGDALELAWDLDGDGAFDDAAGSAPVWTFTMAGTYVVRLRATDPQGATGIATVAINVDNSAPTAVITAPGPSRTWSVGDGIAFSGGASDPEEGTLPAAALRWDVLMHHCPGFDCHAHIVQQLSGVAGGVFEAPDHEYPSYLEIRLTAVDAGGLTHSTSVQLQPETATLVFQSSPPGLTLAVGAAAEATPFTRRVIVGSLTSVSAPSPQVLAGTPYELASWSDGGAPAHDVVAPAGGGTWLATFGGGRCGNGIVDAGEACDDAGACCTAACQVAAAGTVCRAPADACDVFESCDGIATTCPADATLPDDDGDGLCTAVDPCTGGVALDRVRLAVSRLDHPPGDERLRLSGAATSDPDGTWDPAERGLRLLVSDATGAAVLDVTIPPGYAPATRTGWTASSDTTWLYQAGEGGPGGITRLTVRRARSTGRVKFRATGRRGACPIDPARLPLGVVLIFEPPLATSGGCGEVTAWTTGCRTNADGTSVFCR